jgi:AraC family transcriptional regulator
MRSEAKQPTVLNTTQSDDLLKVVPRKPLLSSQSLNWDGCCLHYSQQPAWETPDFCEIHHLIIVNHSHTIQAERRLDNRRQHEQFNKGDIVLIPANSSSYHTWDRDMEYSSLFLEPTHIAQIAYESIVDVDRFEILPCFATPDPLIYQFSQALKSELELGKSCSRFYVDHLIAALSMHLIRHYSAKKQLIREYTDGLSKCKLQRAISYINEHLMENLSLKEMSNAIEMSPYYFTRLFKQSTGMNAYQYVIHCRMERAKHLLCRRDLSIAEVSQQVGFQNQGHFTNAFRKNTGTTPKMYREAKK